MAVEAPVVTPERVLTLTGIVAAAAGVALHLVAAVRRWKRVASGDW